MAKVFSAQLRGEVLDGAEPDRTTAVVLVSIGSTPLGTFVVEDLDGQSDMEIVEAVIGGFLLGELDLDELATPEPEPEEPTETDEEIAAKAAAEAEAEAKAKADADEAAKAAAEGGTPAPAEGADTTAPAEGDTTAKGGKK